MAEVAGVAHVNATEVEDVRRARADYIGELAPLMREKARIYNYQPTNFVLNPDGTTVYSFTAEDVALLDEIDRIALVIRRKYESRSSRSSPGHQGTEGRPSPSACETTRTGYDAPVVAP
jgi:hypothetical protein